MESTNHIIHGNGVDMYDLIEDLDDEDDIRVIPMQEYFWVGVVEQMSPSPPIPRNRTRCYSKVPVYLYKGRRIFSVVSDWNTGKKDFYWIPFEELIFIEKRQDANPLALAT